MEALPNQYLSADVYPTHADLVGEAIHLKRTGQPNTAFAELYRLHINRVYRYILSQIVSSHDAQDVTAQTFLSALEQLETYRSRASFTAWLFGIARRKIVDHHRSQRRTVPFESLEDVPHNTLQPDEVVTKQLQLERVLRALHAISAERREAIVLHIFAELTVEEVAEVMHKSRASIHMLLHRGLADLRQRLNTGDES